MSKTRIAVISILMTASLLGLVFLQFFWIRRDYNVKQERFRQQVADALKSATAKLETRETAIFLAGNLPWADDSIRDYFLFKTPYFPDSIPIPVPPPVFGSDTNSMKIIRRNQDAGEQMSITIRRSHDESVRELESLQVVQREAMREAELALEAAHVEMEYSKSVMQDTMMARERIVMRSEQMGKVLEKMSLEFEGRQRSLQERVSPASIDSLVRTEFRQRGLRLPFSLLIVNGQNDMPVVAFGDTAAAYSESFSAVLFPNDIINRNDKLVVRFSGQRSYFISSMRWMLAGSALFTLVITGTFAVTLITILRQKRLNEMKNDFINNMTHEFNTPITTIRLASETLSNPAVSADVQKVAFYSGIIREENERMHRHVDHILQLALFDKKQVPLNVESFDANELVADAIRKIQLQVDERGGKIRFEPAEQHCIIEADRSLLTTALLNLLDNAVKYSSGAPVIEVSCALMQDGFEIRVRDHGIGMDEAAKRRIFEKFYRVSGGDIHTTKGFGLGLNHVKAIVLAHNGSVDVVSQPGQGSTFIIVLPVKQSAP